MAQKDVDLVKLFNSVTKTLKTEQATLNEADSYNHDHGDNMVKNFKVITKALKMKNGATPSEQLSYASQVLKSKSASGSANMYSQGLAEAAKQLMGQQSVNANNASSMIQALIGAQPTAQEEKAGSGDMLGQILGGLLGGGGTATPTQEESSQSGDMLGGLMGSLMGGGGATAPAQEESSQSGNMMSGLLGSLLGGGGGGQSSSSGQSSGDLGSLLSMGASLLGGGGSGGLGSLIGSLVGNSSMNDSVHHNQSGQLVVGALLGALGKMMAGKK